MTLYTDDSIISSRKIDLHSGQAEAQGMANIIEERKAAYMEDPRNPIERLVDTIDEMVLALEGLKKMILPLLDVFPSTSKAKQNK